MYTIEPCTALGRHVVLASQYAKLDSDVILGGGTDDTAVLQAILDMAPVWGDLTLILDGAALVTGLHIHSNTTIRCDSRAQGLFLKDGSNCALLENAHLDFNEIHDRNISILGGTYNHNSPGQLHHTQREKPLEDGHTFVENKWSMGFEFYGVHSLTIRDITLRNQRTFGMLIANWQDVVMENIFIDLPAHQFSQNQDGIHFWGPGRFLTLRNIRGTSGDDFIALAPDERDMVSSIEDVTIDGVHLDDADQGIRMLSRGKGRLDRVNVRNVTGTYKSFGFLIQPFFEGSEGGNFGHITVENVDLRPTKHCYTFQDPMLFLLAGKIDCLELKNIFAQGFEDIRTPVEFGAPYCGKQTTEESAKICRIRSCFIDGLTVMDSKCNNPVYVNCQVDLLSIRGLRVIDDVARDSVVTLGKFGHIGKLSLQDVYAPAARNLIKNEGEIDQIEVRS